MSNVIRVSFTPATSVGLASIFERYPDTRDASLAIPARPRFNERNTPPMALLHRLGQPVGAWRYES